MTASFLTCGGEMGRLLRAHDWSSHTLGPPETWPQPLKTALRLILNTGHPAYVFWGPSGYCFYNDSYRPSIGAERHPGSIGLPAREVWDEIWDIIGPQIAQVMAGQGATWHENQLVPITRNGLREDVYWTYSYSPIDDETAPNDVGGVLVICNETTGQVFARRQLTMERERQRLMLQQMPGFVALLAGPEHRYDYVNDAYVEIAGDRSFVGRTVRDVFPDIAGQGFYELLDHVYATGEPFAARAMLVRLENHPEGDRFVDVLYQPIRDDVGEIAGVFVGGYDVTDQIEAVMRLRESESRLRALVTAGSYAVYRMSADWQNVQTVDGRGLLADTDAPSARWIDLYIDPADRPGVSAVIDDAIRRKVVFELEHRMRRADGSFGWTLSRAVPILDTAGAIVEWVGAASDVTAARRTQQALQESEDRLRLATENAEVGFWDVDEVNQILHWPPLVKAMFGISPDVPVSMQDFFDGLHPEDREPVAAAYAAAADPARRALYDVEYRTVGQEDGVVRWIAAKGRGVFDAEGQCLRVVGTAINITPRKIAEERLRELNGTLERRVAERTRERDRIWALSRDPFLVADDRGRWLSMSPVWSELLGWSEEELLGRTSEWMEHPDDRAKTRSEVNHLAGGGKTLRFENRFRAKDGRYRWFSWTAVPEAGFLYAVARDVTEEKEREAQLAAAQEALRQAQKMEAIGQLTGGIAHDFNNLLQGVAGSLDLIRRKPDDRERVRRWAEAGLKAAERGARLTAQLLAFSRAQKMELKPVALSDLVWGFRDMLDRTIGAHVRVTLDLNTDGIRVLGDEVQIEMAVLNLALNARDAMPTGGELVISTRPLRIERDPDLADGDYVELAVRDTGAGMPPEVIARAFDPFFTTKGLGKGTGLGLSQVYGAVRQSGGTVCIESRVGEGTTMRLLLRRTDGSGAALAPVREGLEQPSFAARILVVDDDPDARNFLVESLGALGCTVIAAEDGDAGLAEIERSGPDLVILDFAMPGLNGAEVAKRVHQTRPALPIIFSTGFAESAAIEEVAGVGTWLLRKPFRVDDLRSVVAEVLNGHARDAQGGGW